MIESKKDIPILVAHRGYMSSYPENTLIGIEAALQAGACLVEFDIQMDSRGELYVIHDSNLLRTAGVDLDLFTASREELEKVSVHQPDKFAGEFAKTPVPLLSEVLELFLNYPDSKAVVEIKEESLEQWGMERFVDVLLIELQEKMHQCILISFDAGVLRYVREQCDIPVGWVMKKYNEDFLATALELNPDILICNNKKIPAENPPEQGGWQWMLYDIIEPELALKYASLGVEMIETADIGSMLQHTQLKERICHEGL